MKLTFYEKCVFFLFFCLQAIAGVCLVLHYNTMDLEFDSKMNILATGTFFGYSIICGVLLIGNNFDLWLLTFFLCSLSSKYDFNISGNIEFKVCVSDNRRTRMLCMQSQSLSNTILSFVTWLNHAYT